MKNSNKIIISIVIAVVGVVLLVALDQWTKQLAVLHLKDQPDIPLIKDILVLHYLENFGAAFGLLQNKGWLFIIMCLMFSLFAGFIFIKMPKTKRNLPLHILIVFLLAGAIGNLIDRVLHTYVVDFIYFVPINFPVFNIADMYVTVSAAILILLIFFFYKDDDFVFMNRKTDDPIEDDEQERECP